METNTYICSGTYLISALFNFGSGLSDSKTRKINKMKLDSFTEKQTSQIIPSNLFHVPYTMILPIEMKSLSSKTSLIKSSGSSMAPPTVFRMSLITSSLLGT